MRRLYERRATVALSHLAVLGLTDRVAEALDTSDFTPDELGAALWNACRRGDLVIARLLTSRGADVAWRAPWSGETPADIARSASQEHLLPWLSSRPAHRPGPPA